MTGGMSEVYSIQANLIKVCDDWQQVRGVLNYTTLCDRFCDERRQVRGVLNTTLCNSL
jgi:hypothetical protein